jgi:hypothetical protein
VGRFAASAVAVLLALVLAQLLAQPAAPAPPRPRVTVIGDSVATALLYVPEARRYLAAGLDLRLDVRVCRRLVGDSCWHEGQQPPNVLDAVAASGRRLGRVVVIDVGYNDYPDQYPAGIETVMQSLTRAGVQKVVWVTLRERHGMYPPINASIRAAAKRWRQIVVADWNAYSRSRRWFADDGLHLNPSGAMGLARFLRPTVVASACPKGCSSTDRTAW